MELAGVIISALVVLLGAWFKWYTGRDTTYEDLQIGRVDIQNGNIDAVEQRIDRMLAVIKARDSVTDQPSAEDVEKRIGKL